MQKNRGVTLIEALLALAIGSLLFVAFLAAVAPVQSLTWDLSALHDRDSTLCLAAPLLCKWASGAGNNRADRPSCVRAQGGILHLESDMDGSSGFPDGDVEDTYESVSIRGNGSDLQLKSGDGSFQPVFRNVRSFQADITDPGLLRLRLAAEVDKTLIRVPSTGRQLMTFDVYLWNFRPNLFEEAP